MSTTASNLLDIMRVRLKCQMNGTTNPPENVKAATKTLVSKLSRLDGNDQIEITTDDRLVTYKHASTDTILASFETDRLDTQ